MDKKIPLSDESYVQITKTKKRIRVATYNNDPTLTSSVDAEEADANYVIEKFRKTGITPFTRGKGQYLDISSLPDNLFEAQQLINETTERFNELPAKARLRFNNNPEEMYKFLQDPRNQEEAIKLGLLEVRPSAPQNDNSNDEKQAHQSNKKTKAPNKPSSKSSETSESE